MNHFLGNFQVVDFPRQNWLSILRCLIMEILLLNILEDFKISLMKYEEEKCFTVYLLMLAFL
jgi:hypothetical protein